MFQMKRSLSSCLSLLVAILGFSVVVIAQSAGSTSASITGKVSDEQGAAIKGAAITARNIDTNLTRQISSGEDGFFQIPQLPPGNYEVTAKAEGFRDKITRFELVLGTTGLVNLTLRVENVGEVIEVQALSVLDPQKTESSTNVDRQKIDNLPINRRNFLDFSITAARVVADGTGNGATATSGLSFNGQNARFNNVTIDGLDNNDSGSGSVRATFSQDAVQEFQIVSDNYSAEFGRALGGVVNIVTRGGGNEYHGTLFLFNRNDSISARNALSAINPDYRQYQFGSTLSGPIKKDKLFFFTSFERLSIKQNNIVTISDQTVRSANSQGFALTNGPVPFSVDTSTVLGRLDYHISANDTFFARYNGGFSYNGGFDPFGSLTGYTNSGIQRLDDNTLVFNNTYISTKLNLINETRFLYTRRQQDDDPIDNGPQVRILAPEGTVTFGRGSFDPQPRDERFYQIVDNVSLSRGRHQVKFGIDTFFIEPPKGKSALPVLPGGLGVFTDLDFAALTGIAGLPSFTALQTFDPALRTPAQQQFLTLLALALPGKAPGFPAGVPLTKLSLPAAYTQGFGDPTQVVSARFFSAFVQDDIKLRPNLLIKAGLRYDINRADFVPSTNGDFSPRIAISYSPARIKNLNVHATYGIFFAPPMTGIAVAIENSASGKIKVPVIPFPFSILPFALPGHHYPDSLTVPDSINFIPQLSQSFQYQKDLKDSYTQQISAGFDYQIGRNTVVSAEYNFVRGIKLFSTRDINPVVRPVPGSTLASEETGRVDPTRGTVDEFESAYDSYFHGVTFAVNRRFSNHFGFLAHYTLSKGIDDFVDFGTLQRETNNPLQPGLERGLSALDIRHRFVISGIWDLNYTKNIFLTGFQLSTIATWQSGRPYNLLAGVDLNMNGDNPPGDRPLGIGRNAGRLPGFSEIDLRLTRTILLKEHYRIQLFGEVFNLANSVNISDVDRIFLPDAQGHFNLPAQEGGRYIVTPDRYREAFAPRQFQLGFRVSF